MFSSKFFARIAPSFPNGFKVVGHLQLGCLLPFSRYEQIQGATLGGLPRLLKRVFHATFWLLVKAAMWSGALAIVLAVTQSLAPQQMDRAIAIGGLVLILVMAFLFARWVGNILGHLSRYAQCPECGKCQNPPSSTDNELVRWQHTRKDGGRDLRFASNKALVWYRHTYSCAGCNSRWARKWQTWEKGYNRETAQQRHQKAVAKRRVIRMISKNLKQ